MSAGRLAKRVAVVTGASRGIGAAVARAYAREGARVAVAYEPKPASADQASQVVAEIGDSGGEAVAFAADLADPEAIDALATAIRTQLGPIDIVVNNAAATGRASWLDIGVKEWDDIQHVNLRGSWLLARAAYPDLRASDHASIVNVTSIMVETGQAGALHYTASKAGIIGLTRALARELGPEEIRVNAVMPGAIRTEHEEELHPDGRAILDQVTSAQALKRRGHADDLTGTFVFLASDDSAFITGQVINVDGGWVAY